MKFHLPLLVAALGVTALPAGADDLRAVVGQKIDSEYASLEKLYVDLHLHPELSLMEEKTSARVFTRRTPFSAYSPSGKPEAIPAPASITT